MALILLSSLPKSYEGLATTLIYSKEAMKYEEVVAILRSNDRPLGSSPVIDQGRFAVQERRGRSQFCGRSPSGRRNC